MASPPFNNGFTTFATPWQTPEVRYPDQHRRCRPVHLYGRHSVGFTDDDWMGYEGQVALHDTTTECNGDLGWTLDYATAWCYRHLVGNQPLVSDTIDTVRDWDVNEQTPFQIFEHLDTALFGSKLRGMVCLLWKPHWSCSPGTTSTPGVLRIPRIVIQLNLSLFDENSDIDELLDALIHHMIHAYFLVCCGPQKKGEKQDGRLMDGTHFGVILMTIRDITKQCEDGVLPMTFHAAKRKQLDSANPTRALVAYQSPIRPNNYSTLPYISIDPRGSGVGPALADGQTHCMHDNRMISYQAIKNWQVNDYSRALDTDMESKGDTVYEYEPDGKLTPILRVKGPPSVTYVEFVWYQKHVMVPREKALMFKSIDWPLKKHNRYELEVPKCDGVIFACIYDFINKHSYPGSEKIIWDPHNLSWKVKHHHKRDGPPVFITVTHGEDLHDGLIKHVKVFKVAEKLKFTELMDYALSRMWDMPKTTDDAIDTLRWVYDDHQEQKPGPIHAELHKWVRALLARTDDRVELANTLFGGRRGGGRGRSISNLDKMMLLRREDFKDLFRTSQAFRDDVNLAKAYLATRSRPALQDIPLAGNLLVQQGLQPLGLEVALPMAAIHARGAVHDGLLALHAGTGGYGRPRFIDEEDDHDDEVLNAPRVDDIYNRAI